MYQNYTINQLCLPIDLEIKLEENDFAHAIVQFVETAVLVYSGYPGQLTQI